MRRLAVQPSSLRGQLLAPSRASGSIFSRISIPQRPISRLFAKVKESDAPLGQPWFSESSIKANPVGAAPRMDYEPPDERKLKLGKTIRILHERLPSLLAKALPAEILSPQITLRLFPSTHPHLPTVTGRIAYSAALWTSPVAWGRVPVVGNVKLVILSERMVRNGGSSNAKPDSSGNSQHEKLIVRWKTCGKEKMDVTEQIKKMMTILGRSKPQSDKEFHGLFLFEFDEEGRIISHTIEHVEEGNNWETTAKVISVTDWLLGRAWGKKEDAVPGLALCHDSCSRSIGAGDGRKS